MKLRLLALSAFLMCLTSCFDIYETFNLKEDGSGVYEMKMDMTRSLGMLAMMKMGAKEDAKPAKKMDSIIHYNSFTDTSTTLTPEEKAAFKNAYAKIHMDEEEGEMFVHMFFPFKDGKQLSTIQASLNKGGNGGVMDALGKAFKGGMGDMGGMGADPMGGDKADKKGGLPTEDFSYSVTGNNISRKVKPNTKPEVSKNDDEEMPAQFKEMMKVNYYTTVNLPRPAKNVSGAGVVSEDKKQVKFKKAMNLDVKFKPADFDFSIDY